MTPKCLRGLFLLFLAAAPVASAQVVDASVCDVLANPAAFDGKMVRLKDASAVAGFDEFVIDGSKCSQPGAIWLSYPSGTKGKAGPAAFLRLQLAKNSPASSAQKPVDAALNRNDDFARFDNLLAMPFASKAPCLACPRYRVSATLIGRIDGVRTPGLIRDARGAATGIAGFGNLNLYSARLVLQSVADVAAHEIDYSAGHTAVRGDSRGAPRASADQLRRAAAAFGAQGEDNGVEVGFGIVNELEADEGMNGKSDSPDGVLYRATFDMNRIGKQQLSNAMSHVGTHIADLRGGTLVKSINGAEESAWQATFH